jgi:hypothetical protein
VYNHYLFAWEQDEDYFRNMTDKPLPGEPSEKFIYCTVKFMYAVRFIMH